MKIALAFSGGGFRAAAFNLGALTCLHRIQIDGQTLLENVVALSTVSGGTITGARYATGIKKGERMPEIYAALYRFLHEVDLVSDSLARLKSLHNSPGTRVESLINAFADCYDTSLFGGDKFGLLLAADTPPVHLKHLSFNATEFSRGLQFRFQASEPVVSQKGKPITGKPGNRQNRIPAYLAPEIRMGDILAASSCFPGGFEPINFPYDFVLPPELVQRYETQNRRKYKRKAIGIMDGGIVDNQGIEPLLLLENRLCAGRDSAPNALDLMIISDVSSPYMDGFVASEQNKGGWWRNLSLLMLRNTAIAVFALSLAAVTGGVAYQLPAATIAGTFAGTLSGLLLAVFAVAYRSLRYVKIIDLHKVKKLLHIKLGVFELFLKNRFQSVMKLAGSVFMKRIRALNYNAVYKDKRWEHRRIQNAIYELRKGERWETKTIAGEPLPASLHPSEAIRKVTTAATRMGTTLWFKDAQKARHLPDKLIACGQYTLCWNLLVYIEELRHHPEAATPAHAALIACRPQLQEYWERFQQHPLWMVEEYNGELQR